MNFSSLIIHSHPQSTFFVLGTFPVHSQYILLLIPACQDAPSVRTVSAVPLRHYRHSGFGQSNIYSEALIAALGFQAFHTKKEAICGLKMGYN